MAYFRLEEFACPCCGENEIKHVTHTTLERIRGKVGEPMVVTSGYRCKKHNAEVGGKPESAHTRGLASDIKAENSHIRYKIIRAAIECGITRIGIYDTFIHLDCDMDKPQQVAWHGK